MPITPIMPIMPTSIVAACSTRRRSVGDPSERLQGVCKEGQPLCGEQSLERAPGAQGGHKGGHGGPKGPIFHQNLLKFQKIVDFE